MPRMDHLQSDSNDNHGGIGLPEVRLVLECKDAKRRVDRNLAEIHSAYRENYRDHLRYAYALVKSAEVAQDIIQQAFTNALAATERGARIDNMRGFLNSCVHNLCINHAQREHKHFSLESTPLDFTVSPTLICR